jgi:tetratricopeptide (TPR) repeat protein
VATEQLPVFVSIDDFMTPKNLALTLVASIALAVAAGAGGGCNQNKKPPEETTASKYKLLNGSTSDHSEVAAAEPALNVDTRFAAGRVAETQGRLDCAAVQYEQALRLKGNHVPSLYRLGIVQTKMKQFDLASATWRKYIKATGDSASGYSNLGFCYEMAGDVNNAEKSYKDGLQRDANSVPCRTNYGLMLARHNRIPEAENQLNAVLKPDEVRYNLAAVYEQKGEIQQAKAELKKAIEINPRNREAQSRLASLPVD